MSIKRVTNPGRSSSSAQRKPMFCYAGWASWVHPDQLMKNADAETQRKMLEAVADALTDHAELMRESARKLSGTGRKPTRRKPG